MTWPPVVPGELREDLGIEDAADDERLQRRLDAVVEFVQRVRKDAFVIDDCGELIEPVTFSVRGEREKSSLTMGALMLAGRLFARRRSPEAVQWLAQSVPTKVPFNDDDISRHLRIGRHAIPKVG